MNHFALALFTGLAALGFALGVVGAVGIAP